MILDFFHNYKLFRSAIIETKLVVYPTISPTVVLVLFSSFSGTTIIDPG